MGNNPFNNYHAVLEVDRAIADLRRGLAIPVEHNGTTWLLASVETALPTLLDEIRVIAKQPPMLTITLQRAAALGLVGVTDLPLTLVFPPNANWEWVKGIALDTFHDAADAVALHAGVPVSNATHPAKVALQLAKFARLLPAVIMVPVSLKTVVEKTSQMSSFSNLAPIDISDITNYPKMLAYSLKPVSQAQVPLAGIGMSQFMLFRGADGSTEHLAVVVGDPKLSEPVLVRLHSACLTGDIFNSLKCDCGDQLRNTIKTMAQSGGGILIYLAQEGRGIGLANKLRAYQLQAVGFDTVDANEMLGFEDDERRYEAAAEMLRQLDVRQVRLMTNNPRKLQALEKEDIEIVGRVAIMGSINPHNEGYLTTKAKRAGHLFDLALEPDALDLE
jgi:GTP cyclohydrolase II